MNYRCKKLTMDTREEGSGIRLMSSKDCDKEMLRLIDEGWVYVAGEKAPGYIEEEFYKPGTEANAGFVAFTGRQEDGYKIRFLVKPNAKLIAWFKEQNELRLRDINPGNLVLITDSPDPKMPGIVALATLKDMNRRESINEWIYQLYTPHSTWRVQAGLDEREKEEFYAGTFSELLELVQRRINEGSILITAHPDDLRWFQRKFYPSAKDRENEAFIVYAVSDQPPVYHAIIRPNEEVFHWLKRASGDKGEMYRTVVLFALPKDESPVSVLRQLVDKGRWESLQAWWKREVGDTYDHWLGPRLFASMEPAERAEAKE